MTFAEGGRTLYVTGGRQRSGALNREEWFSFDRAVCVHLSDAGRMISKLEYESPPEACPDSTPSVVFKAGSIAEGRLYLCTQTEVLVYRDGDLTQTAYVSLPCFNDVHHVAADARGTIMVANTGLDMVISMDATGTMLQAWNVIGEEVWDRFSPDVDYRKMHTTKPHRAHPNFLFELDGRWWVTRFEQRDAVAVGDRRARIPIGVERPHDGVVVGDKIYFTTVDGHVVIVDWETHEVVEALDLTELDSSERALGWCRGILVEGDYAWVGFTRLRPTAFHTNVSWVKHSFQRVGPHNTRPTRISLYDLARRRLVREIDLEPLGLNAVFSLLDGDLGGPRLI
jgi:hypothetical protein